MEPLTRLLFFAAMVAVAYLSWRIDHDSDMHQAAMAQVQQERENALAQKRKLEDEHAKKIEKIEHDAQQKLESVGRDAAVASRAADGLRQQLAIFAKRGAAKDTATACKCEAEQGRVDLLSGMLAELDGMAEEYAREADEARVRGAACESAYEAVR